MDGEEVASTDTGYLPLTVDRDIDTEMDTTLLGNLTDGVVDRITDCHAPSSVGRPDHLGVVQPHRRVEAGEPRRDHFWPAAEAGKKVGLDESGGDADVGVDPALVEPHGNTRRGVRKLAQGRAVEGIVVHHLVAVDDILSNHLS